MPQQEPSPWRFAVPAVAVIAGVLFGTSAALAGQQPTGPGVGTPTDLPGLIAQRNSEVQQASVRVEELGEDVEALQGELTSDPVTAQADALAPAVGVPPVTGPGVQVVLDDAGYTRDTLPEGVNVNDVVVHQQDVQGVVNALWAGGAEAMMIQDQRLSATAAVQCVGNTLYLRGRVYSPPYTIKAIGDPDALEASLQADPIVATYRGYVDQLGLGYDVSTPEKVEMPGALLTSELAYATAQSR